MDDDHFTKISNETLEKLSKTKKLSSDARVLFAIIRKTLGFHKYQDQIAYSQLEEMTGIDRKNMNKPLKKIEKLGIIKRDGKNIYLSLFYFKKTPSYQMATTIKNDVKSPYVLMDTKERKKSINIDKDISKEGRVSEATRNQLRRDLEEKGIIRKSQ